MSLLLLPLAASKANDTAEAIGRILFFVIAIVIVVLIIRRLRRGP